jgi:acid phosphatase
MRSRSARSRVAVLTGLALCALPAAASAATRAPAEPLSAVKHIVVIYEENHSFDNLYGGWERVEGRRQADPAHVRQVSQAGQPYKCLLQDDVNLATPPLSSRCAEVVGGTAFQSHFTNAPFTIERYIKPEDATCPKPGVSAPNGVRKDSGEGLPGGCTRDLVHRYYQEQYQIDGGKQDRYVTGSDAVGLTMGHYKTRRLPIYRYLHGRRHPAYAISDRFFQAAFGGSFLNHQWLVAAATPTFPNAVADGSANDLHSVVDTNRMPTSYPLYDATTEGVKDGPLTQACPAASGVTCGDWAVNTIQPTYQPFAPGTPDAKKLPPQTHPTIGDRLSAAGVSWAWYSGGWSNAAGRVGAPGWTNGATAAEGCTDPNTAANAVWPNCPDKLFQYHHQPLNYFASFAPGTKARRKHLRDETEFMAATRGSTDACGLRRVSFVKPIGAENEHPGYASEHEGSDHLVRLLRDIHRSACAKTTMVVVTYDEFGGQWDHVSPPGTGGTPGPHDVMGPGTRIPALTIAPGLSRPFVVDHASHDTTSVLATIEHRFGLEPLTSRDRRVRDLSTVFTAG